MENLSSGKSTFGLEPNVAAGLCYAANALCGLGLIFSIITVVTDKTNKLPRFHGFQSIFLSIVGGVVGTVLCIIWFIGALIDTQIGFPIFTILFGLVFGVILLAVVIGEIIACVKAFQGQIFKMPVIGGFADKYSG
jgi:uncharacterized membrane protein